MLNRIEVLLGDAQSPGFCYDRNKYFIIALSHYIDAQFRLRPLSSELFASLRAMNVRGAYKFWDRWAVMVNKGRQPVTSNHIGQYLFVFDNLTIKVAIDTSDGRHIHNSEILDWSDLYFKCNYWPDVDYPEKVVPLVNGNGTLSPAKIRKLAGLRKHEKKYDLVYWSRIWAVQGTSVDDSGVEHNIRIFEALAKVEGKTNLLAVFPEEMNSDLLQGYRKRLDEAGVKWQNGWGSINSKALWNSLASARINFLRPGNHLCVSWRMMDLLCMGACIVLDGAPFAQWPKPLVDGVNFIETGCTLSPDYELPSIDRYEQLTSKVSALIADPDKILQISENNIQYFNEFASMKAVAHYILSIVEQKYPELSALIQAI